MIEIDDNPFAFHQKVALINLRSYCDHRIIDGRESVGFLVAVKEALENPLELLCDNNAKRAFEL